MSRVDKCLRVAMGLQIVRVRQWHDLIDEDGTVLGRYASDHAAKTAKTWWENFAAGKRGAP